MVAPTDAMAQEPAPELGVFQAEVMVVPEVLKARGENPERVLRVARQIGVPGPVDEALFRVLKDDFDG